jgi:hypothetical protein
LQFFGVNKSRFFPIAREGRRIGPKQGKKAISYHFGLAGGFFVFWGNTKLETSALIPKITNFPALFFHQQKN